MTNLIHIGSLTLDATSFSTGYLGQALQGWHSGAPIRGIAEDRPNSDGAFGSVKNYRSARVLTLSGHLLTDSVAACQDLMDGFAAIQPDGALFPLSVENDLGTRSVLVTANGVPEVTPDPDFLGATIGAQFIALDPVKYGPAVTYPTGLASGGGGLEYNLFVGGAGGALYYGALGNLGRVSVVNNGTADVWPSFVISGQLTAGFFIQCLETGAILRYDRIVPAGSTVTLDSLTGEVLVDGVSDGSTYLTSDGWFSIPAKGFATIQFNAIAGSSGTPTMTVTSSDGFW